MSNPLLTSFLLPPFSSIRPEHVVPAVKTSLKNCQDNVTSVIAQPGSFTWNSLCQPLADIDNNFHRIWSTISHLNSVKHSRELRESYKESLFLLSEYSTWIGQHYELYQAYRQLRNSYHYITLTISQKKSIDNTLRDFLLSGIDLPTIQKQRYGEIVSRLSELSSIYSNNVLDATMGWSKLITNKKTLAGIPESALSIARAQADTHKLEGWLLTLDIPSYLPVITYCDNANLREECYRAYNTLASDCGPNGGKWDNGPIMSDILNMRHELAQLLGFKNYAEKSLVNKMAKDPKQVLCFLNDLASRVKPKGKEELEQLKTFIKTNFDLDTLNPWDVPYYSEKQKQYLFSINDEQLRPYFPQTKVINGLFEIVNRIYGITVKKRINVDIWDPHVTFFDVYDHLNEIRGSFYLDLYTRNNKRGGAWMDECVSMIRKGNGELQKPVAYLTCNFNRPISGNPTLFTHKEIITLFHEFGHVLHHILTCIETPGVSGINGVPWDAVELPSQFMENYCWQPEALTLISSHYETEEPIPKNILNKLLAAKHYQTAFFLLRQLECALLDFRLHSEYQSGQNVRLFELWEQVKTQVGIFPTVTWGRFPNTFTHIFSGGYAAGYYSYLWAEVLSADIWSRFLEEGIFNRNTGKAFLDIFLSQGGSEDPMVLFSRFRGREPRIDSMLKHYGF
ncbi:Zn-dependent oligopeptidase [secondary endosymbiont of Heteropsylla cubana]|uniref:oligopeptidase A n=1 Tax=secondary endosymbiont of Heteropsylla cubana TaxID=134287 RepID=J3Z618_9ENTR|nr:oligopeptidase A [secondary endosymbiont of Heteropsylla cubana]AFP85819.1 Zn-dependent oligopeptidase [secondary endosymbiont of Heteropsylla cubana]